MGTDPKVVVTGLGAITPVGADTAATWEALVAGRSGVTALTDDWAAELPARIAAWAAADPLTLMERVPDLQLTLGHRLREVTYVASLLGRPPEKVLEVL